MICQLKSINKCNVTGMKNKVCYKHARSYVMKQLRKLQKNGNKSPVTREYSL